MVPKKICIDCIALAKQGDNALGTIRPSVSLSADMFVQALPAEPFDL